MTRADVCMNRMDFDALVRIYCIIIIMEIDFLGIILEEIYLELCLIYRLDSCISIQEIASMRLLYKDVFCGLYPADWWK